MLQTLLLLFALLSLKSAVAQSVPYYQYTIITSDSCKDDFTEFIEWKKRKGVDIGVVTQEAIAKNSNKYLAIYSYLKEGKLKGKNEYVLLGGANIEYGVTNCSYKYNGQEVQETVTTDCMYREIGTEVDGNGGYSDISIGRIPFTSRKELKNWINKLLNYEKNWQGTDRAMTCFKGYIGASTPFANIESAISGFSYEMMKDVSQNRLIEFWDYSGTVKNYEHAGYLTKDYSDRKDTLTLNGIFNPSALKSNINIILAHGNPKFIKCVPGADLNIFSGHINGIGSGELYWKYKEKNPDDYKFDMSLKPPVANFRRNTGITPVLRTMHPQYYYWQMKKIIDLYTTERYASSTDYSYELSDKSIVQDAKGILFAGACRTIPYNYQELKEDPFHPERETFGQYFINGAVGTVTTNGIEGGGVAYIGFTATTMADIAINYARSFSSTIFDDENYKLGKAFVRSYFSIGKDISYYGYNLFGDPEMDVYTDKVSQMSDIKIEDLGTQLKISSKDLSGSKIVIISEGGCKRDTTITYSVNDTIQFIPYDASANLKITILKHNFKPILWDKAKPQVLDYCKSGSVDVPTIINIGINVAYGETLTINAPVYLNSSTDLKVYQSGHLVIGKNGHLVNNTCMGTSWNGISLSASQDFNGTSSVEIDGGTIENAIVGIRMYGGNCVLKNHAKILNTLELGISIDGFYNAIPSLSIDNAEFSNNGKYAISGNAYNSNLPISFTTFNSSGISLNNVALNSNSSIFKTSPLIVNGGSLSLNNSQFHNSPTQFSNGDFYSISSIFDGIERGIAVNVSNCGTLYVYNSTFTGNGIQAKESNGTVVICRNTFNNTGYYDTGLLLFNVTTTYYYGIEDNHFYGNSNGNASTGIFLYNYTDNFHTIGINHNTFNDICYGVYCSGNNQVQIKNNTFNTSCGITNFGVLSNQGTICQGARNIFNTNGTTAIMNYGSPFNYYDDYCMPGDAAPYVLVQGSVSWIYPNCNKSLKLNSQNQSFSEEETSAQLSDAFTIYPNPASENITIDYQITDTEFKNASIQIIDITGRVLKEISIQNSKDKVLISIQSLSSGIYQCVLFSDNRKVAVKKLVITKH